MGNNRTSTCTKQVIKPATYRRQHTLCKATLQCRLCVIIYIKSPIATHSYKVNASSNVGNPTKCQRCQLALPKSSQVFNQYGQALRIPIIYRRPIFRPSPKKYSCSRMSPVVEEPEGYDSDEFLDENQEDNHTTNSTMNGGPNWRRNPYPPPPCM